MKLRWNSRLELGIPEVDAQHRQIVDYINELELARRHKSQIEVLHVLEKLVDYTVYHFEDEERIMQAAGYRFSKAHKRVHEIFTKKVKEYYRKAENGVQVTDDLMDTLKTWLINHIKHDDQDFAEDVIAHRLAAGKQLKPRKSWLARLFS